MKHLRNNETSSEIDIGCLPLYGQHARASTRLIGFYVDVDVDVDKAPAQSGTVS